MKSLGFLAIFFLLTALLPGGFHPVQAAENVTVYGEYLTDSSGYDYGADFYVDSSVGEEIYVSPYIVTQENVNGSLISGVLILQPYEKHIRIGSFISRDRSKAWSVSVGAKWKATAERP
ncbi:MAG TPA: hypothetical protein VN611_05815 [Patescibacteria group bacterium]|nr:hypothetical protein [Patescibacteria group bacterium]